MFENLSERLNEIFTRLRRKGKLSEEDVEAVLREVRLALLEADVHYSVVKGFITKLRERAVGAEISRALNPAQQVIKIVHEELIAMLGEPEPLRLAGEKPRVILLVGLQGSGKTTAAAKLARILRSNGERVLMIAADPYRPAAITQLQALGARMDIPVFTQEGIKPPALVQRGFQQARNSGVSVVIVDTAGRSQMDQQLMDELSSIHHHVPANEIILVIDAMIGQEALPIAEGFREHLPLTGLMLTKMDGDARGGAAISIRSVTGIPIKYLGTGEGLDALESYDPRRLASRILGMGDVIGLIEKAEAAYDQDTAQAEARKMVSGQFTLEDFANQLRQIRKMGSISQILEMLPGGMGQLSRNVNPRDAEKQLKQVEAIINSMTLQERKKPDILNASRRRRIARGSGTEVQDVNKLIKQFREAQKLMKTVQKSGGRGLSRLFG